MAPEALRRTPLYEAHRALGARMTAFAGWEMPLWYSGILQEHRAVRQGAGLFDISHMGRLLVAGAEAAAFLRRMLTRNVLALAPGQAQYTLLCRQDGGILDDLVAYRLGHPTKSSISWGPRPVPERFLLVVNAARAEADRRWLEEHRPRDVSLEGRQDETAMLALQGPQAARLAGRVLAPALIQGLRPFRCAEAPYRGASLLIARTGYTGEDGFEIVLPAPLATTLWEQLLGLGGTPRPSREGRGDPLGAQPCGLGARDSLRLEAAFPLYGQDIDAATNPFEAGLERALDLEDADFIGREALLRARAQGPRRRLACLVAQGRTILRAGCPVFYREAQVGAITSGGFAPSPGEGSGQDAGRSIALAYLPAPLAGPGTELAVEVRGQRLAAQVVPRPFYRRPPTP